MEKPRNVLIGDEWNGCEWLDKMEKLSKRREIQVLHELLARRGKRIYTQHCRYVLDFLK